jgi:hypothetical protein
MKTYKIWNIDTQSYVSNGNFERAAYDCFPEKSVKQIAGRLCGPGNYEIHEYRLKKKRIWT